MISRLSLAFLALLAAPAVAVAAGKGAHDGHAHGGDYAFGKPGAEAEVNRVIKIKATDDMRYDFEPFAIKKGQTIKFVVTNIGEVPHEFVIGDAQNHAAHTAEMLENASSMDHDADPTAVRVWPGETKDLIWTFDKDIAEGSLQFACHVIGHYQAGMKFDVNFTD